jgi:hypothetical protein
VASCAEVLASSSLHALGGAAIFADEPSRVAEPLAASLPALPWEGTKSTARARSSVRYGSA